MRNSIKHNRKLSKTDEIRQYIRELLIHSRAQGLREVMLVSGDIHKEIGLRNRMPMVCQAMISVDDYSYEIIHNTASGFSSTN